MCTHAMTPGGPRGPLPQAHSMPARLGTHLWERARHDGVDVEGVVVHNAVVGWDQAGDRAHPRLRTASNMAQRASSAYLPRYPCTALHPPPPRGPSPPHFVF